MPVFTAADGARLHFLDDGPGAGPPLLCLAGLTRTSRDFDYLAPHLPGVRLIRPDYRGRGMSDWTGPATYTVAQEAADALALLDHLGIARAALLGTSRGGLVGMVLAATAKPRLAGLCLNDIGPVIERAGLQRIADYVGRFPALDSHAAAAEALRGFMSGFEGVPEARYLEEARRHFPQGPDGRLRLAYDARLREPFLAHLTGPEPDLWPAFDACAGLPLALIRGANSDLLSAATVAEMRRRRPDMILAEVPGRAHIPFLDEPESLAAIRTWLERCR